MRTFLTTATGLALAALMLLALFGCGGQPADNTGGGNETGEANDAKTWWCVEHAVPETMCGVCNKSHGETCKEKGDWCEEHSMADSQCFACHPELQEKFAVMYRNRYGEDPPPIQEEPEGHHDHHDH